MRKWRAGVAAVVLAVVDVPLLLPFIDLATTPAAWAGLRDLPRLTELTRNTLALVLGVILAALPPGIALAVLLYRTDLPGRVAFRRLLVVALFVPLPLLTTAWQSALGASWLPGRPGEAVAWRPWLEGLPMAVWVHAAAGLPWIVWLVGQGLLHVERGTEEVALLTAGPWSVLSRVTLVRAAPAIAAALLWVTVQSAGEITVTDMMLVRTYAEEVYTQFASPEVGLDAAPQVIVGRAIAASVPFVAGLMVVLASVVAWWQRSAPPLTIAPDPQPLFRLGRFARPVAIFVFVPLIALTAVPVASLIVKVGMTGTQGAWSAASAGQVISGAVTIHGRTVVANAAWACVAGAVAALLAVMACWLARDRRWLRIGILLSVGLAWAVPGPVVGAGLKATIDRLIGIEEWVTGTVALKDSLYNGPSLLPVVWAWIVRLWPFAVAAVWPTIRLIPSELFEAARTGGAMPAREFAEVVWPLARAAAVTAGVAVAVLALGELSASKLVATPDAPSFAHVVFAQMHYGPGNTLAGMCLILLVACFVLCALFAVIRHRSSVSHSP